MTGLTRIISQRAFTRYTVPYVSPQLQVRHQSTARASTIDTGFILTPPRLLNPATSDDAFQRIISWYLPKQILEQIKPQLETFGNEAISDQTNELIANAEREVPYVKTRNVWGAKYPHDRLVTSLGWKELGKWGIQNGVVALGYEAGFGEYRRLVQHAFNYIYSASSAVYSCPVSMTSGAARLMAHQAKGLEAEHPFHEVYQRLIARENNWISSQWMTERPGGSDVQNSETYAVHSPLQDKDAHGKKHFDEGDWLISGYKFFCSATDCDVALMLAKTESGQLSLFIAPTKRTVTLPNGRLEKVTNGIRFHRLKNKMGTKELPTAELELQDVRAWMVGPVDRGIATIATLLNVTRTHNFITALSCWRRGMAIAKSFASVRTTINQPLWSFPMHLRLFANMELKFQGLLQLAFFTNSLLSYADNGYPSEPRPNQPPFPDAGIQTKVVQRALTAIGKAVICKVACISLQECQEAMGGVGYMDEPDEPEFNISRLYRDTAANMTWEGTTNVLSSEVVRHVLKDDNLEVFSAWLENKALAGIEEQEFRDKLTRAWFSLKELLQEGRKGDLSCVLADGRQIMFSMAWVVSGILLAHDAQRDGNSIALDVARRWILDGEGGVGEFAFPFIVHASSSVHPRMASTKNQVNKDCQLVWGVKLPQDAAVGYRYRQEASGAAKQVLAAV
ncbi:acyl-CoA dehydrogenase [Acrodontium crateriforme]|uniref:Acyl-CoA dehydrogenase n=1 Tax=Acrodontium crateriforme TaxID=150365 RepID=A0AAQ3MCG4_9PEZI|nr:acyl-CoA dehydrogenase [Acrodontium crateriforme]